MDLSGSSSSMDDNFIINSENQIPNANSIIPKPPPLPSKNYFREKKFSKVSGCSSEKGADFLDNLLNCGFRFDVKVFTQDDRVIFAHSCILGMSSPVLNNMIGQAESNENIKYIKISGVPYEAAYAFLRYLYCERYEEEEMKKYAFNLLALSHTYNIPSLKKLCTDQIETKYINNENVVDLLQLSRAFNAPRLSLICTRFILKHFKTISVSEGWKVMKQANPELEQELLEALVESDTKKVERSKKREETDAYTKILEALEALVHISRDGCRSIGPTGQSQTQRSQSQGQSQSQRGSSNCKYLACKGVELLIRHFSGCSKRLTPGGCVDCLRMWQLLELHAFACVETESLCKVPLCRHLKEKLKNVSKKDVEKWELMVRRVRAAKGTLSCICYKRSLMKVIIS
ncbi:hypothetical protein LUZ60_001932 [Juncus effusus]|nr:hypothetical protein LUZ60_001932 [Juncus effusus]